jgi:hypothetical protein
LLTLRTPTTSIIISNILTRSTTFFSHICAERVTISDIIDEPVPLLPYPSGGWVVAVPSSVVSNLLADLGAVLALDAVELLGGLILLSAVEGQGRDRGEDEK